MNKISKLYIEEANAKLFGSEEKVEGSTEVISEISAAKKAQAEAFEKYRDKWKNLIDANAEHRAKKYGLSGEEHKAKVEEEKERVWKEIFNVLEKSGKFVDTGKGDPKKEEAQFSKKMSELEKVQRQEESS